jgi:hypothetical protein
MLVQLNRHADDRRFTATSTQMPLNPAYTRSMSPVVAVLGHPGRVAGLAAHLPAGWSVRPARDLDDIGPDELVLVAGATEAGIVAARDGLPRRTLLVALVDEDAPAELVAAVLTAGADVCVRGGMPAILAGHLVAGRRRQLADRWSGLRAEATFPG